MQNNIFPTLFVGQNFQKLEEVDSTNTYLKQMLSKYGPPANGTVIMADYQTAGRGQYGNKWITPPGKNLMVSFFLEIGFLPMLEQFKLSKAVSLAVHDCLTHLSLKDCKVKWPNDIYVADKKIAGILIENRIQANYLKDSVIGIGINANQAEFSEMNHATSILNCTGNETDLILLLKHLSISLEKRYLELKEGKDFEEEYLEKLFRFGQLARFKSGDEEFEGKISGIDSFGKLIISEKGKERYFDIKEVSFVR